MKLDDVTDIVRHRRRAIAPPPATRVSEWAEMRRYLPTETAADAGPWRNARTPWLVEIMDCLSPSSPVQEVVFQSSARVGKTECINNTVGFFMDSVKCPIMVAQPIEADAEEWSKDHLDPMIAHTPALQDLITPDKDRRKGNTILHKKYRGGVLYAVGANSGKSFRRRTVRVGLGDELDAWPGQISGEGDPWLLFGARTATFPFSRKLGAFSTPTIRGSSRIESLFMASDQRYFRVPCPECGLFQRLIFSRLSRGETGAAEYLCDPDAGGCGALIPEWRRDGMVARGRWVPTFPGRRVVGFHISQLYSPWVSWSELLAAYDEAHHDQLQLQVFTNTRLGETFDVADADSWDPDGLLSLRVRLEVLPARVACLTAGVDVQADRIVVQIDGWGPGEERWTVDRIELSGDPTKDPNDPSSVWAELDKLLLHASYPHALGGAMKIRATGLDTGGLATAQAYKFCRPRKSRRVWAVKGDSGREGSRPWPKVPSRKNKGNLPLYLVGVFACKETCMSRLRGTLQAMSRGEREGPGLWHFAARESLGPAFFEELTSEVCVVDTARARGGRHTGERRRRWQMRRGDIRNEGLDCAVYSYAVLHGLYAQGFRLERPVAADAPTQQKEFSPVVADRVNGRKPDAPAPDAAPPAPSRPRPVGGKRPRWT
jgi:phage terminase large subunit GpA-like protein